MKHEGYSLVEDAARSLGLPLSPRHIQSLLNLESILRIRAIPAGLVAVGDSGRILDRHVVDCLRGAVAVEGTDTDAYDLGSGAGLPGIVVAIARPNLRVCLVEARSRRVAFLEELIRELGLENAEARHDRIESLSDPVDLCFARALGHLARSWELAARVLRPGGRLIYFAGVRSVLPNRLKGAVEVRSVPPLLASSGPLVIMSRR